MIRCIVDELIALSSPRRLHTIAVPDFGESDAMNNNYPKLHNAAWPGLVGKGPDSEPAIDLDTMINLTASASVSGVKFDGMDLFLFDPHISIDIDDDRLKRLADKFRA